VFGLGGDDIIWISSTQSEPGEIFDVGDGDDCLILTSNQGDGTFATGSFDLRGSTVRDLEILAFTNTGADTMEILMNADQMIFLEVTNFGSAQTAKLSIFMADQTALDLSGVDLTESWVNSLNDSLLTVPGDADHDTITGADEANEIYGMGGNDLLMGDAGNDYIEGGDGFDWIMPGRGDDTIFGNEDRDMVAYSDAVDVAGAQHEFSAGSGSGRRDRDAFWRRNGPLDQFGAGHRHQLCRCHARHR
jgi:Ca2+-binding RTX toxin-like protein